MALSCIYQVIVNKFQMEKSKRKRGISLSHHKQIEQHHGFEESRVRQVVRPIFTGPSTPNQPRFSSAPKPKIIFSYAQQSSDKSFNAILNSAQSNSAFSQSSNIKSHQIAPTFKLASKQTVFDVIQQPKEIVQRRLFTNIKRIEKGEVSTQTERKNYFINNQYGISQGEQNIQTAFAKEQYQKLMENRRKHLGISNKVFTYKQEHKQAQPFSKIELTKQNIPPEPTTTKKSQSKSTAEDLQSLQEMEKRLREIINICDNGLS